ERLDRRGGNLEEPRLDQRGGMVSRRADAKPKTEAQAELARGGDGVLAEQRADRGGFRDARKSEGNRSERRHTFGTDGIVVRVEAEERQAANGVSLREVVVARHREAGLGVVTGEQRDRPTERRIGV